ncbi:hypothetical protein B296_00000026 [Ensete ventricosum]|uniref:Uncharacterized protein n=1 Tax=Ensete ventricosum TaxID=4639 RepID=A0A427AM39_ENSVE|nr:hypothetical protein B296_00000026 [Ensete ventricosum]
MVDDVDLHVEQVGAAKVGLGVGNVGGIGFEEGIMEHYPRGGVASTNTCNLCIVMGYDERPNLIDQGCSGSDGSIATNMKLMSYSAGFFPLPKATILVNEGRGDRLVHIMRRRL